MIQVHLLTRPVWSVRKNSCRTCSVIFGLCILFLVIVKSNAQDASGDQPEDEFDQDQLISLRENQSFENNTLVLADNNCTGECEDDSIVFPTEVVINEEDISDKNTNVKVENTSYFSIEPTEFPQQVIIDYYNDENGNGKAYNCLLILFYL